MDVVLFQNRRIRFDWSSWRSGIVLKLHISFPLSFEQQCREHNCNRCITLPPPQGGNINSMQNGLLLRHDLHRLFDS